MKRILKNVNTKKKTTSSKRIFSSNNKCNNPLITQLIERRRLELSLMVHEQNRLNINQTAVERSVSLNYNNSKDKEDGNPEDERNYDNFVKKEWEQSVKDVPVVSRKKIINALRLLENETVIAKNKLTMEERRFNLLKKHCSRHTMDITWWEDGEHSWDSSMYIIKKIRACILTRNWNSLTNLLLLLLNHNKIYLPFIKQVSLLNVMHNPMDNNGEILEELQKLHMPMSQR